MNCFRMCLLALVATLANADSNGFMAKSIYVDALRTSEGGEVSQATESNDIPQLADAQKREAASLVQMNMASEKGTAEAFVELEKHLEQARQLDAQKESEEERKLSQIPKAGVAVAEPTKGGSVADDTSPAVDDTSTPNSFIQVQSDSVDPDSDVALYRTQDEGEQGDRTETFIQVDQVDKGAEDRLEQARQLNDKKENEEEKHLHSAAHASFSTPVQVQSDFVGPDSDLASLKVEGEAFIQVQSATTAVDQESDLVLFGKQVEAWTKLHPDSDLALHLKERGVSFMQVAQTNVAKTEPDGTTSAGNQLGANGSQPDGVASDMILLEKPWHTDADIAQDKMPEIGDATPSADARSSFAQVQSDFVDPESDLALYSKERSLMQMQSLTAVESKEKRNAGFSLGQLWKTMQARHWVPSVAPISFAQVQSDYIDPESDFAQGLQAQGKSPEETMGGVQVKNAPNVADNQLNSLGTQLENNAVKLIGTDESLTDAATSENTLGESAGYSDSEIAVENGPALDDASPQADDKSAHYVDRTSGLQSPEKKQGFGVTGHVQNAALAAKVVVNSQALQNNGGQVIASNSFVQVQSEQDPESDLALYSEVYQGGSMDL